MSVDPLVGFKTFKEYVGSSCGKQGAEVRLLSLGQPALLELLFGFLATLPLRKLRWELRVVFYFSPHDLSVYAFSLFPTTHLNPSALPSLLETVCYPGSSDSQYSIKVPSDLLGTSLESYGVASQCFQEKPAH